MGFASIALVKRDLLCRWRWLSERRRREQICLLSAITSHGGDHAATGASKQLRVEWPGILTWAHWNEQCNRGVNAEDAVTAFMLGLWICGDRKRRTMARFYQPDLSTDLDSPFVRDGEDKLIRRSYWLDMDDRTLVMVMVNGIGANLTNDEKRAHLIDLRREHLIDQVCIQEVLPPKK